MGGTSPKRCAEPALSVCVKLAQGYVDTRISEPLIRRRRHPGDETPRCRLDRDGLKSGTSLSTGFISFIVAPAHRRHVGALKALATVRRFLKPRAASSIR